MPDNIAKQLASQLRTDLTDEQVSEALKKWGEVCPTQMENGDIPHWFVVPFNENAFTEATDFSSCEAKWGGFNIVRHELHRIRQILPPERRPGE